MYEAMYVDEIVVIVGGSLLIMRALGQAEARAPAPWRAYMY